MSAYGVPESGEKGTMSPFREAAIQEYIIVKDREHVRIEPEINGCMFVKYIAEAFLLTD